MAPVISCPLCGWDAKANRPADRDALEVECNRCGHFITNDIFARTLQRLDEKDKALLPYLTAYTRQASETGTIIEVHTDNWKDFALLHRSTPISTKLGKVLEYVASQSPHPGAYLALDFYSLAPLFDAVSDEEVQFLVEHLIERGYLRPLGDSRNCALTAEGWARLEPSAGAGIPRRCFVAMSFDSSLDNAWELGFRAGLADCGCTAIRVDKVHHNEKICDKILGEIRLAQFLVADFTHHRHGVYFEAGFAMGLGRPVIWTCREDELGETHFDTRQYNHILWREPNDLRTALADRIRATITI